MVEVGPLEQDDAEAVSRLFGAYMQELFGRDTGKMTAEVLLREGRGGAFNLLIAKSAAAPIGFAAWWPIFDLHHAVHGGEVPDLYVAPAMRGGGVAVSLLAEVARQVKARGGVFLMAPATPANAQRLIRAGRLDAAFPGVNVYWTEQRFAALAEGAGLGSRRLARDFIAAGRRSPPPLIDD